MKNVKKIISFDLDGVLADHAKNKIKAAKKLGYSLRIEQSTDSILEEILKPEDIWALKKIVYGEMSLTAGIINGAKEVIEKVGLVAKPVIVSRRQPQSQVYALEWLKKNFAFPEEDVFFVDKDEDKRVVLKKIKAVSHIDDKPKVLRGIKEDIGRFLFDEFRLYSDGIGDGIFVVHSFDEFLELVKI